MKQFRIKIIRSCEFEVDMWARSSTEAIKMVMTKALDYDDRDLKETKIVSIKQTSEDIYHTHN